MPCGRLATQGASPQALAFAKVMGQGEGSLLAVHWLFDSGSSEAALAKGFSVRTPGEDLSIPLLAGQAPAEWCSQRLSGFARSFR